jgi:RNA polymerase sigma factor (sigma-70 family)
MADASGCGGLEREAVRAGARLRDQMLLDLYLAHRSALIAYAARIVGSRVRAEDLVQDAYLRVQVASDMLGNRDIARPVAYLYRIVRNLAVDWKRHLSVEDIDRHSSDAMDSFAARLSSPEQEVLHRQQLRLVAEALAELPQRTQTVFEMRWLEGHTLHEIAERLDVSVTLAHQLSRSAVIHCAKRLSEMESR